MRRTELEHVIRAAADVAGDNELVIVGSQAILGQFPDAPESMLVSREADIYPRNHGWCLEVHDLVLSKCAASRERDWDFSKEALRHNLVDPEELQRRAADLPLSIAEIERIQRMLNAII